MKNLVGCVALITGGASGLGKATAERFAAEGAWVVIADLTLHDVETTAAAIGAQSFSLDVIDFGIDRCRRGL